MFFEQLFSNKPFVCAALGWVTAQVLKFLISLLIDRKLDWRRFFGMGRARRCLRGRDQYRFQRSS